MLKLKLNETQVKSFEADCRKFVQDKLGSRFTAIAKAEERLASLISAQNEYSKKAAENRPVTEKHSQAYSAAVARGAGVAELQAIEAARSSDNVTEGVYSKMTRAARDVQPHIEQVESQIVELKKDLDAAFINILESGDGPEAKVCRQVGEHLIEALRTYAAFSDAAQRVCIDLKLPFKQDFIKPRLWKGLNRVPEIKALGGRNIEEALDGLTDGFTFLGI